MNPVLARTANSACASCMPDSRVFVVGGAAQRHPQSIHVGSNSSIQVSFNLPCNLPAVPGGANLAETA